MSFANDDLPLESANAFTTAPQFKLIETQQDTQPDAIAADTSVINEGSNAEPPGETNPEAGTQQSNIAGKRAGRRSMMTAEEKKQDNKLRKLQRKEKKAAERIANAGVNANGDPNQEIKTDPLAPTTSKLSENAKQGARQKEQGRRKRKRAEIMAPQHAPRQGIYGGSFLRSGGLQGQSTKQAQQFRPGPRRGPVTPDKRYGNKNFRSQISGQYDNVYAGYGPPSFKRQPPSGYYDSYGEGYYNDQGYGQNQASHNQYGDSYGGQYDDYYRQYGGYGGGQDYGYAPYQQRPQNAPMAPPGGRGDEMITMRKSELTALLEKERAKERKRLRRAPAASGDQSMALQRRQDVQAAATDMIYDILQKAGIQVQELPKQEQEGKQLPSGDDRGAAAVLIEFLRSGRDQHHTPPPVASQTDEHMNSRSATPPRPPASTSADGFLSSSASNQEIAPQRSLSVPPNAHSNDFGMNQQINNDSSND